MTKKEVEAEEMTINVKFRVPKELDPERLMAIFHRFGPFHDGFMKVVEEELRKDGYAYVKQRKEGG